MIEPMTVANMRKAQTRRLSSRISGRAEAYLIS
jgi:hypothetical protein